MTTDQPVDAERVGRAVASAIHKHWLLFLIEGIILILLGVAAIMLPLLATLAFTIIIGWIFLVSGIVGLVSTFWARHAPGFWWSLLSAVLAIVVGFLLLGWWPHSGFIALKIGGASAVISWPTAGEVSLTLLLIAFFVIEGVASIMYAVEHRRQLSGRWGWMLVSGTIDLILAGIILAGLPGTAAWALGLLVGINMVFGGAALIAMALAARHPPERSVLAGNP